MDEKEINNKIIAQIAQAMQDKKMNKAELAKGIKKSKSFVSQLFKGNRLISLKILSKIINHLDVDLTIYLTRKFKYSDE